MCRIAGIKHSVQTENSVQINYLKSIRDSLAHGGPDGFGIYSDDYIALGHRRLSIIDLSDAGKQPMIARNLVITFNGEIYNYEEIKIELQKYGYTFTTGTDTEVILKSFEKWGYDAVQKFRGMFAFAIWNKQEQKLILCRDRVGVKPLFWYKKDELFMFASELKAFHEHPDFDKSIDIDAVSIYLQQGYIHAPHCIFKYAHKLEPGTFLEINKENDIRTWKYWDIEEKYRDGSINKKSENEIVEETEDILKDSFQLRMVADVPVGMFLSGGIDSSLVTSVLQKQTNTQLKTFTIGFEEEKHNEANHAKAIAKHIGTDHTELYCTEKDFLRIIPKLPFLYDEPFGDSSAIPTHLVSELAKTDVKVVLSADGGDEIWGGYTKYEIYKKFYPKIKSIPSPIKSIIAGMADLIDPVTLENNANKLPFFKNYANVSHKFFKVRNALKSKDSIDFFNISSSFLSGKELEKLASNNVVRYKKSQNEKDNLVLAYLGMIDIKTYLEGDIMTKVDRATMHVALEGREPFLDQNIIEYAMTVPDNLKMKNGIPKYLLRQVLYKYVPADLIDRPKQGFSIPIEQWLRGFLKDELIAISEDTAFFQVFQLSSTQYSFLMKSFLNQSAYVNPYVIWFLYSLYQWYLRWMK